ncbi:MAG: reverse transcriptase-like protein [Chloroflexi bacterium]|nr:MAG: ribonuclease H [Phototrophicales bacterium]RMF81434.1 MAG: reverse transcriptase-like protein [Chloroflexota bacterium]
MIAQHGIESPFQHLTLFADGSLGAHHAGAGVVVVDRWQHIVAVANRTLPVMTNNEAEYAGLLLAMEIAHTLHAEFIEVRLDSEVVVFQMIGRFAVNSPALRQWHQQAAALARHFTKVRYTHIKRERNNIADALAVEASAGREWRTLLPEG